MRNLLYTCAALLVLGGVPGCGDDESPPAPTTGTARVLVVHASPDAPGVDLFVDDVLVRANLSYPGNTGYLELQAGTRNVKVNVAGTNTTVISASAPVVANTNTSVFACDSLVKLTPLVMLDDLSAPAAGKARIRFLHLSPNTTAVDLAIGGAILFGNRAFKESGSFVPVDAGMQNVEVRLAGSANVVVSLPAFNLQAGRIYTLFVRGFTGGSGGQALGAEIIVHN